MLPVHYLPSSHPIKMNELLINVLISFILTLESKLIMMTVKINFTPNQSEKVQNFKNNLITNGGIEFVGAILNKRYKNQSFRFQHQHDCVTIYRDRYM